MTKPERQVAAAVAVVQRFCGLFHIQAKSRSWLHRLLGRVLGRSYREDFWTTIGFTSSWPSTDDAGFSETTWISVLHEGLHAADASRLTRPLFGFIYLLPQALGLVLVPLLLALHLAPWLVVAALLLAVAPLPAPGRAWAEFRAYEVDLAARYWAYGDFVGETVYENYFTDASYWWMMPFRGTVTDHFEAFKKDLVADRVSMTPYMEEVRKLASAIKAGEV